jgi:hypothetical protein
MGALPGSDSRTAQPALRSNETRLIHSGELRWAGWSWRGGREQTGEKCAESEERCGREQTARGKGVLHPVGEDGAEKAVTGKTDDDARGRADERDARGDIEHIESTTVNGQAIIKTFVQPTETLAPSAYPCRQNDLQYLSLRPIWGFSLASILNCYYNSNNTHWR